MLHERGTPRPLFLVGAGVATAAVAVLAAFADLGALYPVTILAGLAFGAPSRVCNAPWIQGFPTWARFSPSPSWPAWPSVRLWWSCSGCMV